MQGTKHINITRINATSFLQKEDVVIEELPLQIAIVHGREDERKTENLSVTMRTPGDDHNLVIGFLFGEGIIKNAGDVLSVTQPGDDSLLATLTPNVQFDATKQKRNFVTSSACGFCGKTDMAIATQPQNNIVAGFEIHAHILQKLVLQFNNAQSLFTKTGGAHAVALFTANGELLHISEDVGRHNAMDKLIGAMLQKNALPLSNHIVLFSGRLGYELVQKAAAAGIPAIASIGAPTSLAIEIAKENNIAVAGFLKESGFNIYSAAEKIIC